MLGNPFMLRWGPAVAVAAALFAVTVDAAERPGLEESRAFVERVATEAVRTWRTDYPDEHARFEAMNALVHETFAVDFITRAVVGRYWRDLSPDEQSEFRDVFPRFVVRIYLPHVAKYNRDHLRILGSRARGERDVIVKSQVRGDKGSEWLDTDWRIRTIEGELRVLDIVVAGVSLILVQRQEFEAVIRRDGFGRLVERLRERADQAADARG